MKKDKHLTEDYLLAVNLGFLSVFGIFLIYELDKSFMPEAEFSSAMAPLLICGLATVFLALSIQFRNRTFHVFCVILSILALTILSWPS